MEDDNLTKQIEEIEALTSIYGSDWKTDSESTRSYSIILNENKTEAILSVTLPYNYPGEAPPKYEISAPSLERNEKLRLYAKLDEVYLNNIGETVLFQWVESVREFLQTIKRDVKKEKKVPSDDKIEIVEELNKLNIKCPEITHGEVIVDRKSSFQGHAAKVESVEEVNAVLSELKQNKKFQNATHNMYAYRIEKQTQKGPIVIQDCDDDGEDHAGGRMLHLLHILQSKNTLVVVSRWYGGIQLGPDRFRHINNAARQVIKQAGL